MYKVPNITIYRNAQYCPHAQQVYVHHLVDIIPKRNMWWAENKSVFKWDFCENRLDTSLAAKQSWSSTTPTSSRPWPSANPASLKTLSAHVLLISYPTKSIALCPSKVFTPSVVRAWATISMAWFSNAWEWTKSSETTMQHAAPSWELGVEQNSTQDPIKELTEVGLHMNLVRFFVILGAASTSLTVHPSRNCE